MRRLRKQLLNAYSLLRKDVGQGDDGMRLEHAQSTRPILGYSRSSSIQYQQPAIYNHNSLLQLEPHSRPVPDGTSPSPI